MSALYNCGLCCTIISIWGVVQLTIMGICYKFEVVTLLEDVEPHEYEDYDDFIKKTSDNYSKTAVNCWLAAAIYLGLILVSLGCIAKANINMKKEAELLEDTELFCTPKSFM